MFDPAYFDQVFYDDPIASKGATRNQNGPTYRDVANVIANLYGGQKLRMVDVGCGVGWVPKNLQDAGERCDGIEVSEYAVTHSVVPIHRGDVRTLDQLRWTWDVVICERVLGYLPEADIPRALRALHAAAPLAYLGIITTDHERYKSCGEAYHRQNGRQTFRPCSWWFAQMQQAGFQLDVPRLKKLNVIRPGWHEQGVWPLVGA
jgi:SAM-dependent methyltransferase